jgi:hypothetical protein
VAEKHYGVSVWSSWDETRDKGQQKDWDNLEGIHRATTMTWFIKKVRDLQTWFEPPYN